MPHSWPSCCLALMLYAALITFCQRLQRSSVCCLQQYESYMVIPCVHTDMEAAAIAALEQEMQALKDDRAHVSKLRTQLEQASVRMEQEKAAWKRQQVQQCLLAHVVLASGDGISLLLWQLIHTNHHKTPYPQASTSCASAHAKSGSPLSSCQCTLHTMSHGWTGCLHAHLQVYPNRQRSRFWIVYA